jgi:hypothetical protein
MPLLEFPKIENKKGTFIRIFWIIIRKVSGTRFISTRIYSHLSTSEILDKKSEVGSGAMEE